MVQLVFKAARWGIIGRKHFQLVITALGRFGLVQLFLDFFAQFFLLYQLLLLANVLAIQEQVLGGDCLRDQKVWNLWFWLLITLSGEQALDWMSRCHFEFFICLYLLSPRDLTTLWSVLENVWNGCWRLKFAFFEFCCRSSFYFSFELWLFFDWNELASCV